MVSFGFLTLLLAFSDPIRSEGAAQIETLQFPNDSGQPLSNSQPNWIQTNWITSTILGDSISNEPIEEPLLKFKKQALQRVAVSGGTLLATKSQDLNSSFAEASLTVGVPLGSLENILAISPGIRVDWLDAPSSFAVPEQVYDVGLEFFHQRRLNDRWRFLGIVRPSIRSDFETNTTPVRIFGLGLFLWETIPNRLTFSVGSVYLGRPDLPPLPAAGLIWTPNNRRRLELQFPRSRWLARVARNGSHSETWINTTIGIGGNTWMVQNAIGQPEEMSLRDIRWTIGIQKSLAGGGGWFAETGLAMDRRLEFLTTENARSLSSAVVFSAGWAY